MSWKVATPGTSLGHPKGRRQRSQQKEKGHPIGWPFSRKIEQNRPGSVVIRRLNCSHLLCASRNRLSRGKLPKKPLGLQFSPNYGKTTCQDARRRVFSMCSVG